MTHSPAAGRTHGNEHGGGLLAHACKHKLRSARSDDELSSAAQPVACLGGVQGIARAVALVRDRRGRSPDGACDALLGWLRHADNAGNAWDDSALTAARLEALASLRPSSPQVPPPSPACALMRASRSP